MKSKEEEEQFSGYQQPCIHSDLEQKTTMVSLGDSKEQDPHLLKKS